MKTDTEERHVARVLGLFVAIVLSWLAPAAQAQTKPAADAPKVPAGPSITVKLVTDFESGKLVSDVESIEPVVTTEFGPEGSREVTLGQKAVLWVRNAHVDGKFFFEKYYQEKYIGRSGRLEIDAAQLGPGEHAIQPGDHKFTLSEDGKLASQDPDIRIEGSTLSLRLYKVTIHAVDDGKTGPSEFRLVPGDLGLLSLDKSFTLDAKNLPDPKVTHDPQKPAPTRGAPPALTNMLSQQEKFLPLSVWLPANQSGQGYVLYPSWQAFHLTPEGKVQLDAAAIPRVPGIEVSNATIVIPHRKFSGVIHSRTNLTGGVGAVRLAKQMDFSATLAPSKFIAAHERPPEDFFLSVDNDFSRHPYKFFVADNTTADKEAIRLLALEWGPPIFARGDEATIQLRLLETAGKAPLKEPEARVSYSLYHPSNPVSRDWHKAEVLSWKNGRESGELKFRTPDLSFGFVILRVQVFEKGDASQTTTLSGEIQACIIEKGQTGTASVVTNRGRNAFVAGEDIELQLVLRSESPRPAGQRKLVLVHPDASEETLAFPDSGAAWFAQSFHLSAERSVNLAPGEYRLMVRDLPQGITAVPLEFDLVGRQKESLFHIVKPSKYTKAMNGLEPSHIQSQATPIDLDRAVRTFADLGYTRVDLMSYMTNHHLRGYTWREELAANDPRLPPPAESYTPNPREQILNACVRNQLQYSDVWLSYGDFHLPRYIEGYTRASERWMAREIQAMRHSPAMDGMILYDEMYQSAVVGFVPGHQKLFANIRARLAEERLGLSPAKIEQAWNRYLQRPRNQRDPQALQDMLKYQDFQQHGWAEYVNRVVKVGKQLAPQSRYGTYHRTWAAPGTNDDIYHGYPPDLFKNLDIASQIHYADNSTSWVSIPLLAQVLRVSPKKVVYVNMPLTHEVRTQWDGQYQRHMAFAMLAQGANGVSQWGLPHTFDDGPNPGTAIGRETTRWLNTEILRPFGEINDHTREGYRKIGIVSTQNQHALSQFKQLPVANQTEGIWIACWRLGYPALFLREDTLQEKLDDFSVIFVPGVRFDDELDPAVVRRLKDAIAAGIKVVVEADSVLDLPGITKLNDWVLNSYFVGDSYFPTWSDDELNKVYEKSQPIVDYLRPKLVEWQVEPAARGSFKVGPRWRDGGDVDYLMMANFDDPDYSHTVRQQMAKPELMPLSVAAHHGKVAYDLLAQKELELKPAEADQGRAENSLTLDMRRVQGAMVAFLPERIGKLQARYALSDEPGRVRIKASLVGQSGKTIDGVFPVRITLEQNNQSRTFYRVLGRDLQVELDLPQATGAAPSQIEIREALSGQTVKLEVRSARRNKPTLALQSNDAPHIPYPGEVRAFLHQITEGKKVVIVATRAIPGAAEVAQELQARLAEKGIAARIVAEDEAYHQPTGDPQAEDPLNDGFHAWHGKNQETIGPAMVVDEPVILLAGRGSSFLVEALTQHGYLTSPPLGGPGAVMRPSIQVANKGLHFGHDALCLLANDVAGMKHALEGLFGELPSPAAISEANYAAEQTIDSKSNTSITPVLAFMGTNEQVQEVKFDSAGNLYASTWGHGKNLYSFAADGKLRFARHLPEMGINHLDVFADRIYAYTSSGARLYQLKLDNTPVAQARLNMDPGNSLWCDNYQLSEADYTWLPGKRQLLHNMTDRMRMLDEQFNIVAEWHGEEYADKDVSDTILRRRLHAYAMSPDMSRIAQLETSSYFTKWDYKDEEVLDTHLVIRDLQGKLLYEYKNLDNGKKVEAALAWPTDSSGPIVYAPNKLLDEGHERWAFDAELKLVGVEPYDMGMYSLGGERRLLRDGGTLVYRDTVEHVQCRLGPLGTMPTFVQLSPDGRSIALLDEYGVLSLFDTADGKLRARWSLSELGKVVRFTPDSQRVIVAGYRGDILNFDLNGKLQWQANLGEANDVLGKDLLLIDPQFVDYTQTLWPVSRDEAGEIDKLVRVGGNRLINGDCESAAGWQGPAVTFHPEGYQGGRSLAVGPEMVGQEVTGFLGTHSTWVLEFFYRSRDPRGTVDLLAGLMTQSDQPDSVARHFQANGDWRFGRMVIKNGGHCEKLMVGFSAQQGEAIVDQVQLRQLRFPSVNHLLYEPLYALKPVVLENPLFSEKYDPVGNLREQAPSRVLIPTLPGPLNLVESAYMQNGRLNEIGSHWYIQPFNREAPELPISLTMKEPRWISTVALYFNAYDADNVTPHFDIYAVDPETKKDKLVASIRHNGQLFRLVKFPPIKTPQVKVTLVNTIARLRTLTEIELYGPLSGREGTPGFVDADGQNTYMGDFSRVDKRPKKLADKFLPPVVKRGSHDEDVNWYAPFTEILVSEDKFHVGRTFGKNTSYTLAEPTKELYWTRTGGLGFTPFGALYGGLLLRCGNDGKLYCIDPDSGAELWTVPLGGRLFGCPVAIGEDIFVAGDNGQLYQLDVASGTIMKQVQVPGVIFGSLATDGKSLFFISDDGFLHSYHVADLQPAWKTPIALYTDSTPAVDKGVVYLADQQGQARAVDAATGKVVWTTPLGDEFSRCPVVGPDKIIFGCNGGTLAVLNRADGKLVWTKQAESRFQYEPVLLEDKILFFRGGSAMLAKLADGLESPLRLSGPVGTPPLLPPGFTLPQDPAIPISYYQGRLFFIDRPTESGHPTLQVNIPWHVTGGSFTLLVPAPVEAEVKK
jgi:outer membrane protein assembly factor BamB